MIRDSKIIEAVAISDPIRLDPNTVPPAILAQLIFTGTATASVEYTPDKPDVSQSADNYVNNRWFDVNALSGQSADISALIDTPVEAIRLNVSDFTDGTVELKAVQGYRV